MLARLLENFLKVRKFVLKLGREFSALFDSMWIRGEEKRMEIVAEERRKFPKKSKRL